MKNIQVKQYSKFVVALVTAVLTGLSVYFNSPQWLTPVLALAGALGVYAAPNKQ